MMERAWGADACVVFGGQGELIYLWDGSTSLRWCVRVEDFGCGFQRSVSCFSLGTWVKIP